MNVTITVTETRQSLLSILLAINPNAPRTVAGVWIRGDSAQANTIYVGNSQIADSNYAWEVANSGDVYEDTDQSGINSISIPQIYLKAKDSGGSAVVHCRVRCF